jgi:hypothetical protein
MTMSNLTQAQLQAIRAGLATQYSATGGGEAGSSTYTPSQYTLDGMNYVPDGQGGYWGFQDNPDWNSGSLIANYNGTPYTAYDAQGNAIGSGRLSGIKNDNFMSTWGPFAMVGAGFGAGLLSGAGMAGAGGSGAFVGEGASSGIPAWDTAGTGLSGSGSAAGGVGAASGASGGFSPAASDAAFNSATAAGPGTSSGDYLMGSSAGMAAPAASAQAFTKALADQALPTWMKVGGSLLGAALGTQGVKTNNNVTSSMNPQVAPYVYGGLLPGVQGLLSQQTSPQAQQGWQQVQNTALGLLNQPVAGNGFSRFFPGK